MSAFSRAQSPSASLAAHAASLSLQASGISFPDAAGVAFNAAAVTNAARYVSASAPVGLADGTPIPVSEERIRDAVMQDAAGVMDRQRAAAASAAVDTFGAALARCSTFSEIAGLVPEPYRDTLRPLMSKYYALAQKLEQSDDEYRMWSEFSTENLDVTWPECVPKPALPNLQMKKEAADSVTERQQSLKAARKTYVSSCLRTICSARQDEIVKITALIDASAINREIAGALVSRFKVLAQRLHEGLDLQEWFQGLSASAETGEGFASERLLREQQPNAANAYWTNHPGRKAGLHAACLIFDEVNAIALPAAIAAIQLVRVQALRSRDAKRRKAEQKVNARAHAAMDIDQVGDARREVLSNEQRAVIGDMLSRQVNKQMAKLGGRHAQVSLTNLPYFFVWVWTGIDPSRLETGVGNETPACGNPKQEGRRQIGCTSQEGQGQKTRKREGESFRGTTRKSRPRKIQETGQEIESQQAQVDLVVSILSDSSWTYENSDSYPDSLLNVFDSDIAARILCTRIPKTMYKSFAHANIIHIGPEVEFDYAQSLELSAGLKYMFHNKFSKQLVRDAYKDFTRRATWKLIFINEKESKDHRNEYIPLFAHKPPSDKWAWSMDEDWNRGLEAGWKYVEEFDEADSAKADTEYEAVSRKRVKAYLELNNYLLLMTDKNLGCALVTRDWYIRNTKEFLRKTPQFVDRTAEQWHTALNETCKNLSSFCTYFDDVLCDINKMIPSFILHKIAKAKKQGPPDFKGLPKIHKNPWAFRPIIPCHSIAQAPLATFLSWYLKPMVEECFTVIHGSKDLSIALTKLNSELVNRPILPGRKLFFVTGDITAFYTNVNRHDVERRVLELWIEAVHKGVFHKYDSVLNFSEPDKYDQMMKSALRIAGQNLYYVFNNQYGEQTHGLAMGVPHSPDLANLFGYICEKSAVKRLYEEGHLMYFGRYIDDALMIVEADSRQEALEFANRISYAPCHIGWEVADHGVPFLDMHMWFSPGPNKSFRVDFAPYRKAFNHLERIPWGSSHPFDVKRGTFYGELSRIAVLSSEWSTYCSAVTECVAIYQSRGYPTTNLMNWVDAKMASCWNERHSLSRKKLPKELLWVLKSRFNPAWEKFNTQDLRTRIVHHWTKSADAGVQKCVMGRFIVSRKATFQMRDMINALNKKMVSMGPDDF